MSGEQADFYQWLQDLTTRSVAEQARALQRYNELVQRALRGEFNDPQFREDYLRFATEESSRYVRDVAQLSLNYYQALLDLGRSSSERFFEQMLHGSMGSSKQSHEPEAPPADGAAAAPSKPRQVTLELQGAAGQEATASFVIENQRDAPAEISFLVSDFVDAAGGPSFRAPLRLEPPQLSLGPRAEAQVKLRLPLPGDLFTPGHSYVATVVVRGYDELELILRLRLAPAAQPAAEAPPRDETAVGAPEAEAPAKRPRPSRSGKRAKLVRDKKLTGQRPQP
jgi:hypothetical protein